MKNYLEIAYEKGLYEAQSQLEMDAILSVQHLNKTSASRALKLNRTTLEWKLQKLGLGRYFLRGPEIQNEKGDLQNGKSNQENCEENS